MAKLFKTHSNSYPLLQNSPLQYVGIVHPKVNLNSYPLLQEPSVQTNEQEEEE